MSTYCLTFFFIDSATRSSSSDFKENLVRNMRLFEQEKSTQNARQPLATISSNNQDNTNTVKSQNCESIILDFWTFSFTCMSHVSEWIISVLIISGVKREGNFLNKDDPKVATLLQQADLLCSLATKIKSDNTSQSMDEAWQVCMAAPTSCYEVLSLKLLVLYW